MKTFNVNKNSWHYWIASLPDENVVYSCHSICDYIKKVIGGLIFCIALGFVGTTVFNLLFCIVRLIFWHISFKDKVCVPVSFNGE